MASVTVEGIRELLFDLREFPDQIQQKTVDRLSQIAYDAARQGAGRHIRTGALWQSVFNRPLTKTSRIVEHDRGRAPHAVFVIQGTRPHVIVPRYKQALRWPTATGFAFAKRVNHPGYAGDPYMDRAADKALGELQNIIGTVIRESL